MFYKPYNLFVTRPEMSLAKQICKLEEAGLLNIGKLISLLKKLVGEIEDIQKPLL